MINKPELLSLNGPLLIASNHPNSFLDAVILDILFQKPIWSLARGDVFINKNVSNLLKAVRILPVFRTTEGVENLSSNYETFDECIKIFRKKGLVQIFSEGQCFNEWHLRPLKKGTARLANQSWNDNVPLQVLPVGINYSSYKRFGKNVFVNFGNIFSSDVLDPQASYGFRYQMFNASLETELKQLVYEIGLHEKQKQKELLVIKQPLIKKVLLFFPAVLGWILHAPLYLPAKYIVHRKHSSTGHFDAILTAILFFSYPFYLLMITVIACLIMNSLLPGLLLLVAPFCAWSYVQLKQQLDE